MHFLFHTEYIAETIRRAGIYTPTNRDSEIIIPEIVQGKRLIRITQTYNIQMKQYTEMKVQKCISCIHGAKLNTMGGYLDFSSFSLSVFLNHFVILCHWFTLLVYIVCYILHSPCLIDVIPSLLYHTATRERWYLNEIGFYSRLITVNNWII